MQIAPPTQTPINTAKEQLEILNNYSASFAKLPDAPITKGVIVAQIEKLTNILGAQGQTITQESTSTDPNAHDALPTIIEETKKSLPIIDTLYTSYKTLETLQADATTPPASISELQKAITNLETVYMNKETSTDDKTLDTSYTNLNALNNTIQANAIEARIAMVQKEVARENEERSKISNRFIYQPTKFSENKTPYAMIPSSGEHQGHAVVYSLKGDAAHQLIATLVGSMSKDSIQNIYRNKKAIQVTINPGIAFYRDKFYTDFARKSVVAALEYGTPQIEFYAKTKDGRVPLSSKQVGLETSLELYLIQHFHPKKLDKEGKPIPVLDPSHGRKKIDYISKCLKALKTPENNETQHTDVLHPGTLLSNDRSKILKNTLMYLNREQPTDLINLNSLRSETVIESLQVLLGNVQASEFIPDTEFKNDIEAAKNHGTISPKLEKALISALEKVHGGFSDDWNKKYGPKAEINLTNANSQKNNRNDVARLTLTPGSTPGSAS